MSGDMENNINALIFDKTIHLHLFADFGLHAESHFGLVLSGSSLMVLF